MATLLIDMPSGIAGDMLLAALLACGGDPMRLGDDLARLGLGPIGLRSRQVMAGPLAALRVEVDAPQEAAWRQPLAPPGAAPTHPHRPWRDIDRLLANAPLPARAIERARAVFRLLAEAEGTVHGCDPETVEFHEVGALDSIADVLGCCLLLEQLGVERVVAGPILAGSGRVRCAHGEMPVPVPAVAALLARPAPRAGVRAPLRDLGRETGELTTPTGAALVLGLADAFIGAGATAGTATVLAVGYGAGGRTVPGLVNAVRCCLLETAPSGADEEVLELRCQMDDATGEELGRLLELVLAAGALDAWLTPVLMKKGRPGHLLGLLVRPADRDRIADLVLTHSPSIGLRWSAWQRRVLPRHRIEVEIDGRRIVCKQVELPDGSHRTKPEAESVAKAAADLGWSFARVAQAVQRKLG